MVIHLIKFLENKKLGSKQFVNLIVVGDNNSLFSHELITHIIIFFYSVGWEIKVARKLNLDCSSLKYYMFMLDDLFILIPKKYYQILQIQGVLKYKIQKGSKRRIKGKLENRVSKKSRLGFRSCPDFVLSFRLLWSMCIEFLFCSLLILIIYGVLRGEILLINTTINMVLMNGHCIDR